ncbi:MAG: flagellar motor control protein ZomB [Corynebacterium sp.]|uniref:flagellar motor control protein ZomB n=1 Tax=Corynebacterium sp. TaxID=1720 RepID=UPI0026DEE2E9|nr:flagellar motor control protein ZomB [Corynebacterium sp.]MDO5669308.1 flagellar motor control protein ZomB [Corynebacterium sp.]
MTTAAGMRSRASLTLWSGAGAALVLAILAFIGGWRRRWMSDDGLIVLRTVRNLLAGNGPVFNAGERVEANTSTLWQYLIYLAALVTDARLEVIATWLALAFTTAALGVAAWGTARLHRRRASLILIPAGGLVYLALPPARDFATSGLEWGLSLLWIAGLWWLLATWSHPPTGGRHASAPRDHITYALAFWTGISWLVRPELALYGGLAGLLLLVAATSWKQRALILAVALPVPAAYQIFRMGYYGLLTPHTAVAKSAGDAEWASGWDYVLDLTEPYVLWVALALLLALGAVTLWRLSTSRTPLNLRSPVTVTALVLVAGTLHLLYVLRVGGDFMHGRMLLLPLFALLLPVMVVPLTDLRSTSLRYDGLAALGLASLCWWSVTTTINGHPIDWETDYEELGIVDERDFWTYATFREKNDPPMFATDFLTAKAMNDYPETAQRAVAEDVGLMTMFGLNEEEFSWTTGPRIPREYEGGDPTGLVGHPPTLFHINLGMTSMNAPLEMRVLDTVGLATPLAARQPRDPDARVGHDKWLPFSWQAADTSMPLDYLPPWYDQEETTRVRESLQTPAIAELMASYREPMSPKRFLKNIRFALTDGRTLELSLDPDEVIEEYGPVTPGIRLAWPNNISPENPR